MRGSGKDRFGVYFLYIHVAEAKANDSSLIKYSVPCFALVEFYFRHGETVPWSWTTPMSTDMYGIRYKDDSASCDIPVRYSPLVESI